MDQVATNIAERELPEEFCIENFLSQLADAEAQGWEFDLLYGNKLQKVRGHHASESIKVDTDEVDVSNIELPELFNK